MTDPSLDLVEGDRVELVVGAPAHGGHCVARLDGRVLFVRHALPGERVTAEITERHKAFLRADAVEIHDPSPDRVAPPCPHAHPGGCGGCDLQHVAGDAQLRWKTEVVQEQLRRLANLSFPVRVEALPATPRPGSTTVEAEQALLGWRSRVRYAVDAAGRPGLLQHRSHQVVPVDRCRIAHPAIQELDLLQRAWPDADAIEVTASTGGDLAVFTRPTGSGPPPTNDPLDGGSPAAASPAAASPGATSPGGDGPAGTASPGDGRPPGAASPGARRERLAGPLEVVEVAVGRRWRVPPEGFWQIHPAAADTLAEAVVDLLRPAEGETAWDLYGGAGLFAAAVTTLTRARTTLVESSPVGCAAARANLTDLPTIEIVEARVETALHRRRVTGPVDLVVLDPPRSGAGAKVVRGLAQARPRAIAYVACDPAALARDVGTFRWLGWRLTALRAFDCFPMTQHVECVALLEPPS
ncbi:class I SAM-dependent RNA methyltransferase [Paractinoplanes globisporus]|uniref:Class I SAM-dependent RNA methyltransferase n=1 Tax=Paractinoplanes globisporus TaxID=113565 RepID=A0ABW6WIT6_9ACTN|nr:TRAM domain-containing protein [Actinoplanes globisporus]